MKRILWVLGLGISFFIFIFIIFIFPLFSLQPTDTFLSSIPLLCRKNTYRYLQSTRGCESKKWKYLPKDRLQYINEVESMGGWMDLSHAYLASVITQFQQLHHICGDVGEIGVHHGKYAIAIALASIQGEKLLALDLFRFQQDNRDQSGAGDLEIFRSNLLKYGINPDEDVIIIENNTLFLNAKDLYPTNRYFDHKKKIGPFRFFSVDGGHTNEVTKSDLHLVSQVLVDGGIVTLDDWTNSDWPGVVSGYYEYFFMSANPLVPFVFYRNKLYLTTPSFHSLYYEMFLRNLTDLVTPGLPNRQVISGNWTTLNYNLNAVTPTIEERFKTLIGTL